MIRDVQAQPDVFGRDLKYLQFRVDGRVFDAHATSYAMPDEGPHYWYVRVDGGEEFELFEARGEHDAHALTVRVLHTLTSLAPSLL